MRYLYHPPITRYLISVRTVYLALAHTDCQVEQLQQGSAPRQAELLICTYSTLMRADSGKIV